MRSHRSTTSVYEGASFVSIRAWKSDSCFSRLWGFALASASSRVICATTYGEGVGADLKGDVKGDEKRENGRRHGWWPRVNIGEHGLANAGSTLALAVVRDNGDEMRNAARGSMKAGSKLDSEGGPRFFDAYEAEIAIKYFSLCFHG